MPAVLFRCDGGLDIGIGHVMRCRALAAAFREQHWTTAFAMAQTSAAVFQEDDPVVVPDGVAGAPAVQMLMAERRIACLVVDHYGLDAEFERRAANGSMVVAIDDLADRTHDCDLLVDSNPARTAADYAAHVAAHTRFLLGPHFAMLRAEFAQFRRAAASCRAPPRHLVVAPGGADPGNISARLLDSVPLLSASGLNVTLIVGQANPHKNALLRRAGAVGAAIIVNPPNAVALMASADIAISGAGMTCLEFACLGVPTVALVLADNQRAVARAIVRAGAAVVLDGEFDSRRTVQALLALAADADTRKRLSAAGQKLIDGRGAIRVAAEAVRLHAVRKQNE